MMNPLINKETRVITCRKGVWAGNELLLAQCFGFEHDALTNDIRINMNKTAKKALSEFLKVAYRNFYESPVHETERMIFFSKVKDVYNDIQNDFMSLFMSKVPYYDKMMYRPGQKFAYQPHAVMEMINRKDNLLAFDMRTGKSITAVTLSVLDNSSTTLIICPGTTKFTTWHDDMISWGFDKSTFTVYDAKKKYCKKAFNEKFVIINYDIVGKHIEDLKKAKIEHIIIDEAHALKNTGSQRFKACHEVVQSFINSRITLLSGTPIANRVDDMFAYFKLIGHPLGHNKAQFIRTYGIMYNSRGGEKVKKAKNTEDLAVKLSNFMIRRTQSECFDVMPKEQIRHMVDKDDFKEEYDRLIEEMSLHKNHAALSGHIMAINNLTASIKVPEAFKIAEEAFEYGKKVVIFCSFTAPLDDMQKMFNDNGYKTVRIDGSVDMSSRRDIIKEFKENEDCNVFLGNMKAASEGIDLSCASEIIFLNFPFTPKEIEQAMERCTSMANPKIVTVHHLVCEESIDEVIYDIIVDKKQDIDAIIDKGKGAISISNITGEVFRRLTGRDFEVEKTVTAE